MINRKASTKEVIGAIVITVLCVSFLIDDTEEQSSIIAEKQASSQPQQAMNKSTPPQPKPKAKPKVAPRKPAAIGYRFNSDEAVKAAEGMENILFMANAEMRNLVSYIDVSSRDGHLMVMAKKQILSADRSVRDGVFFALRDLWRETKYVREKHYAGWVSAKHFDTSTGKTTHLGKFK